MAASRWYASDPAPGDIPLKRKYLTYGHSTQYGNAPKGAGNGRLGPGHDSEHKLTREEILARRADAKVTAKHKRVKVLDLRNGKAKFRWFLESEWRKKGMALLP